MPTRRRFTDSPFDTLERTFELLTTGPRPLALDGKTADGLPRRPVPLGELKARLLHPSTPYAVRDAAVSALVARAQAEGGAWIVGLAGVLLPGLRRATWALVRACPEKAFDIEAEALTAFLTAVRAARPGRPRLAARLCWLARSGAAQLLRAELAEQGCPGAEPVSAAPPRPWGHPDLVLAHAVRAGILCTADAELIGTTRIEGADLAAVAEHLGVAYKTCHQRRRRAERALRDWLCSEDYSRIEFVENGRETPCSRGAGRPRQEPTDG